MLHVYYEWRREENKKEKQKQIKKVPEVEKEK
jgi:hypothetical protein